MPDLEKSPLIKTSRYGRVEITPKTSHLSLGKFRAVIQSKIKEAALRSGHKFRRVIQPVVDEL